MSMRSWQSDQYWDSQRTNAESCVPPLVGFVYSRRTYLSQRSIGVSV